jgi:hypothetical protein
MPVPGRAAAGGGNRRLRFVVVDDPSSTRIAVLLTGISVTVLLARLADRLGWPSTGGFGVALLCVAAVGTTGRVLAALRRSQALVVAADATGISVGPGWAAHFGGDSVRRLPWDQVVRVELFPQDYGPRYRAQVRHHLRVTTGDGRVVERALPATADVAALARVLDRVAPGVLGRSRWMSAGSGG